MKLFSLPVHSCDDDYDKKLWDNLFLKKGTIFIIEVLQFMTPKMTFLRQYWRKKGYFLPLDSQFVMNCTPFLLKKWERGLV